MQFPLQKMPPRWRYMMIGAWYLEREIEKLGPEQHAEKETALFGYLSSVVRNFPSEGEDAEDPKAEAVNHMVSAIWEALNSLDRPETNARTVMSGYVH